MTSDAVARLADEEAGFVLGAALLGLGVRAAARLDEPSRARCVVALDALATGAPGGRAASLERLVRRARASTVAECAAEAARWVHPSWIDCAFAGERTAVVLAIAAGLPEPFVTAAKRVCAARSVDPGGPPAAMAPALRDALQQRLLAELWPPAPANASEVADLVASAAGELLRTLSNRGASLLGWSLRGAPDTVIAAAMARVGRPLADLVAAAARSPGEGSVPRDLARSLVARVARQDRAGSPALNAADRILALGALAVAHGASEPHVARLARRLPWCIGHIIEDVEAA